MDKNFPSNFTYLLQENVPANNVLKFRIKEITEGTSVKKWIAEFSAATKTTWRIAKTYPASGKCNVYRLDLRCEHATDKRVKGIKASKNTDCPASLTVTVKRYIQASRSKNVDELIKEWPTICKLKNEHNHELNSVQDTLRHRDRNDENNSSNDDLPSPTTSATHDQFHSETLTDCEILELDELFKRIKCSYLKEPKIFGPAIKKMLKNAKQFAGTRKGLASALCTFGLCNGVGKRKYIQNRHRQNIGVQPTSIIKRKSALSGKRKLSASRPTKTVKRAKALKEHD